MNKHFLTLCDSGLITLTSGMRDSSDCTDSNSNGVHFIDWNVCLKRTGQMGGDQSATTRYLTPAHDMSWKVFSSNTRLKFITKIYERS